MLLLAPCCLLATLAFGLPEDDPREDIILDIDESAPPPELLAEPEGGSDIRLNPAQKDELFRSGNAKRNTRHWKKNSQGLVEVPYVIDSSLQSRSKHVEQIKKAIADYTKYTCIRWTPRPQSAFPNAEYVRFLHDRGCYSYVGEQPFAANGQTISLGDGCENAKGTVIHEMMHTIGFYHEQSRPDRDSKVRIHYENVVATRTAQFEKLDAASVLDEGTPYDVKSVMHYGPTFFSKNGELTIEVIDPRLSGQEREQVQNEMGQRYGFAATDVIEINNLYECPPEYNQRIRDLMASKGGSSCQDNPPLNESPTFCADAKAQGLCSRVVLIYEDHCKATCDNCADTTATTTPQPKCSDGDGRCPGWAEAYPRTWWDYCAHNAWVKSNCELSCCGDSPFGLKIKRTNQWGQQVEETYSCPEIKAKWWFACDQTFLDPNHSNYARMSLATRNKVAEIQQNCAKTCGFCDC